MTVLNSRFKSVMSSIIRLISRTGGPIDSSTGRKRAANGLRWAEYWWPKLPETEHAQYNSASQRLLVPPGVRQRVIPRGTLKFLMKEPSTSHDLAIIDGRIIQMVTKPVTTPPFNRDARHVSCAQRQCPRTPSVLHGPHAAAQRRHLP